jgi:hypothetical protein
MKNDKFFDDIIIEFDKWYYLRQKKIKNIERRHRLNTAKRILTVMGTVMGLQPKERIKIFFKYIEDKKVKVPKDIKNKLLLLSLSL